MDRYSRCLRLVSLLIVSLISPIGFAADSPAQVIWPDVHAGNVVFSLMPGWKVADVQKSGQASGMTTIVPEKEPPGGCAMVITPAFIDDMGDDVKLALKAARELAPPPYRPFGTGEVSLLEGTSGKGWHFLDLYGLAGDPRQKRATHVLVANLGKLRVVVTGFGSSSIETNLYAAAPEPIPSCLAGQNNLMWVALQHTLRLPGFEADSPELGRQLVGEWSRGGKYSFSYTFGANGEYAWGAAHGMLLKSLHPGQVEEHMTTIANEGKYEVHGDRWTKSCPGPCGGPASAMFSIVRQVNPKASGYGTWTLRVIDLGSQAIPHRVYFTDDYSRGR